jgi:hypothetical protein
MTCLRRDGRATSLTVPADAGDATGGFRDPGFFPDDCLERATALTHAHIAQCKQIAQRKLYMSLAWRSA